MSTLLKVTGLLAGHNRTAVVRELNLDVADAEIVALLGPNGAGKTTALDTICGLLPAMAGEITLSGHAIGSMRQAATHGVAYVPESRGLFRQLSVDENLRLRSRSRAGAAAIYERFPRLGELRSRQAGLLSGGEQQLLALACALSLKPRLLIIDEMTMGLAPEVIRHLAEAVRSVAQSGVSVLFVEQHVHIALELCDRAYVLTHGRCVLEGTGRDLLDRIDELSSSYFSGDPSVVA